STSWSRSTRSRYAASRTASFMVLAACRLSRACSSTRWPVCRSWTEIPIACAWAARISASACSRLLIADLEPVVPGVDPGRVAARPLHLHRVPPDLVHPPRLHVVLHLRLAHHPPAAPLLHAFGAGAARPQPAGRESGLPAVVPANEQVAVDVEGQGDRLRLRLLGLDLVEEAHGGGLVCISYHAPVVEVLRRSRPALRAAHPAPDLGAALRPDG